jgi:hypothetical protein
VLSVFVNRKLLPKEIFMMLWFEWFRLVQLLKTACSRWTTFLWMVVILAGLSVRTDRDGGVTSLVRAVFLKSTCYNPLRQFFHSDALNLEALLQAWVGVILKMFPIERVQGKPVLVADGFKNAKEGKKMPAVKSLHQESNDNSKPEYIMGHSFQCLTILARSADHKYFAVPIVSRIHEGLIFSNRDRRTLLDKLAVLFCQIANWINMPCILLADAYYASRSVIMPLLAKNHVLITRARINSVGYLPAPKSDCPRRGRPRQYGEKIHLRDLFKEKLAFQSGPSPVYDEKNVMVQLRQINLLWRPVGQMVQFVLVSHPNRGKMILMSTDLTLDPWEILRLFGLRFKIEIAFKQAVWTLGSYAYRFWMMKMKPTRRREGNRYLHKEPEDYRRLTLIKMGAYHRYVALGCIAQGLLQYLAIFFRQQVWANFGSWLRTMKTDATPSEQVVAQALRNRLPEFLASSSFDPKLKKFLDDKIDACRVPSFLADSAHAA